MEARVTAFFRMPRKRTEDALEYSCLGRDLTTLFAGNFCRLDPFSLFIASFPPLFRAPDSYCYVHLKHSTWKSDGQAELIYGIHPWPDPAQCDEFSRQTGSTDTCWFKFRAQGPSPTPPCLFMRNGFSSNNPPGGSDLKEKIPLGFRSLGLVPTRV